MKLEKKIKQANKVQKGRRKEIIKKKAEINQIENK